MQIFALDPDPRECARQLDSRRVVKMVSETAQILSTALWLNGYVSSTLYKPTHRNHPCVKWAAASRGNYAWLLDHWRALIAEYSRRYTRRHKSSNLYRELVTMSGRLPSGPRQPFVNCAANKSLGIDYTWHSNVNEAYQFYLMAREEEKNNA